MARERFIAAWAVVLGILILSAATAQAAPVRQGQEPSPTPGPGGTTQPSPTPVPGRLVTLTPITGTVVAAPPTPTLLPPPSGGGRVAVDALYVRDNPAFSGAVLGILPYGQGIYPVGRNGDNTWIAVNWGSQRGWVYEEMVVWDAELDLGTLPILVQATGVPPTATTGPSPTQAATPTPPATDTPSATTPPTISPTDTPMSAAATETLAIATLPAVTPTVAAPPAPTGGGTNSIPIDPRLPLFGGLGLLILTGILYVWQWSAGRADVKRYARGFILSICPVCQEGHIQLDEVVRNTLGIQWVRRSARCDYCRSVLREIRPGVWRYSVDAFVNPEMAERFKTRRITTAELHQLAQHVVLKPSRHEYDEPTAESLDLKWLEIDEPLGSDEPVESDEVVESSDPAEDDAAPDAEDGG